MTLGQIAFKYMLNILTGPREEAIEGPGGSCKEEEVERHKRGALINDRRASLLRSNN